MTVNYTTNLSLGQPVTGTESGTWGDDVNNSVTSYLDIAIAGGLAITITTTDVTLSITQGTSSATNIGSTTAQYAILNVSGAMTAARNLIVPSSSRIYLINNNTTGGFALTVKGSATSGVTMVNGEKAHVFWNGTDYAKLSNTPGGAGTFSSITNTGLTSGRVVYSTTGGLETDSANLTFDGTTLSAAGLSDSGNLTFTGTGNRITGDFSNATNANRVSFQTSTVNGSTIVQAMPNGTGTFGSFRAAGSSDPDNASVLTMQAIQGGTQLVIIRSDITGTGTYLPMTFYTGGSERMRLDTSGNVGIGTSSPSAKFDTTGTGTTEMRVRSQTSGDARVGFWAEGAAYNYIQTVRSSGALSSFSDLITFNNASGTERMRIDSSGNVGIGTSSPNKKLEVFAAGTTVVTSIFGSTTGAIATLNYSSVGGLQGYTTTGASTTADITLQPVAGNVGIGTNSPTRALTVYTTAASDNNILLRSGAANAYLTFADIGTTDQTGLSVRIGSSGNGLLFQTGGTTTRMAIDSSGNVGIGTSSPSTYGKFVVSGSSNSGVGTFIGNASLTGSAPTYQGSIRLIDNPTSSTGAAGGIEFLTSTFGSGYGWKMAAIDSSGVQLTFATRQNSASWTEAMRIDTSGNVLVGTTSTSGTSTNTAKVVGGLFFTASGTTSAANATATTIFTCPALPNGVYIVNAQLANNDPAVYMAVSLISVGNATLRATSLATATNMSLTVSGQNIQATQTSGSTNTITWTITRFS